jgi:DnaJ-class molecular chaperone
VKPGWKAGTRVHFGASPQDGFPPVTFVLAEAKHRYFTRRADDLVWRKQLTRAQVRGGCDGVATFGLAFDHLMNRRQSSSSSSSWQAAKDIIVRVPVLSGQEVRVPIKANAVPLSGQLTLREKGHGMPKKGGGFGDLVVELFVANEPGGGGSGGSKR